MKSKLEFLKEQEVHQVYIGGIVYEMVKISHAEKAMENYTKQKLQQHGVMQAASDGAEGATVGNSAAGKGMSVVLCKCDERIAVDGLCLRCGLPR